MKTSLVLAIAAIAFFGFVVMPAACSALDSIQTAAAAIGSK